MALVKGTVMPGKSWFCTSEPGILSFFCGVACSFSGTKDFMLFTSQPWLSAGSKSHHLPVFSSFAVNPSTAFPAPQPSFSVDCPSRIGVLIP